MGCACLLLGCVPIQPPATPEAAPGAPQPPMVLSAEQPIASLPLPAALLDSPPAVLEVPVERIENAADVSFTIAVFLEWPDPASGEVQRAEVGRFAVHPPDRAGRYALDAAGAFAQLPADSPAAMLVFELEALGAAQPLGGLRVELGLVAWR